MLALVMVACMTIALGCSSQGGGSQASSAEDGVAATVNGKKIMEQDITDEIQKMREQIGAQTDEVWASYLSSNNMTPSSMRSN